MDSRRTETGFPLLRVRGIYRLLVLIAASLILTAAEKNSSRIRGSPSPRERLTQLTENYFFFFLSGNMGVKISSGALRMLFMISRICEPTAAGDKGTIRGSSGLP